MRKPPSSRLGLKDLFNVAVLSAGAFYWAIHYYGLALPFLKNGYLYQASSVMSVSTNPSHYGKYFAASIFVLYFIFRTIVRPLPAFLLTLVLLFSSYHLYHLIPSLYRDYAKAPYILLCILLLICLAAYRLNRFWILVVSWIGALIVGYGISVRTDLMVFVLPFVVTLALFTANRLSIKFRAFAITTFLLVFGWSYNHFAPPQISRVGLLWANFGFTAPFNDNLEIVPGTYNVGNIYNDSYQGAIAVAETQLLRPGKLVAPEWEAGEVATSQNDRFKHVALTFPADTYLRIFASIKKILQLPFSYALPPIGVTIGTGFYETVKSPLNSFFGGTIVFFAALAFTLLFINSPRLAFFYAFFVLFLCSYPMLQFAGRHYFHLEFVGIWIVAFCFSRMRSFFTELRTDSKARWQALVSVLVLLVLGPLHLTALTGLRSLQKHNFEKMLSLLEKAPAESLKLIDQPVPDQDGKILISSPARFVPPNADFTINADYLLVDIDGTCGAETLWLTLRYAMNSTAAVLSDFSESLQVDLRGSNSRIGKIYFPAIYQKAGASVYFSGVEALKSQRSCIKGVSAITYPPHFPVAMVLIHTESFLQKDDYHQKLAKPGLQTVPVFTADEVARALGSKSLKPFGAEDFLYTGKTQFKKGALLVHEHMQDQSEVTGLKGYAYTVMDEHNSETYKKTFADVTACRVYSDILKSKVFSLKAGDALYLKGVLRTGGFFVSLLKEGSTRGALKVVTPGEFERGIL